MNRTEGELSMLLFGHVIAIKHLIHQLTTTVMRLLLIAVHPDAGTRVSYPLGKHQ